MKSADRAESSSPPSSGPDITVVTPTYNRKESILALLETVYAQEDVSFEVIVVDDNSKDGTAEAILERFPKTKVLRETSNKGPAVCRNRGIREARGKILVGIDSDVTLPETKVFTKVLRFFEECKDADGVAFHLLTPDGKSEDVDRWWHPMPIETHANKRFETSYFSGTAYAFRLPQLKAAGMYPETLFMHYEEVELAFRLIDNGGKLLYTPELLALHHENKVSRRVEVRTFFKPRNQILLAVGCYPVLRGLAFIVPRIGYGFLKSIPSGDVVAFVKAIWSAIQLTPQRLRERKPLKSETWKRLAEINRGQIPE